MDQSGVITFFQTLFTKLKKPASTLPSILLHATAIQRSGLSPTEITANVIERCRAEGIPTGDNPDGSRSLINIYSNVIVKCIVDALKQDGVVQVAIPANSLVVQSNGANAGGPIVTIGSNITYSTAKGIIQ